MRVFHMAESGFSNVETCRRCQGRPAHAHPALYLGLDIDCLDPAFAPGTGTPEPGGRGADLVLSLLADLADLPFVGIDGGA